MGGKKKVLGVYGGRGVPFCRHWSSQWTFRGSLGHRGIPTGHAALPNVKLTFDPV